MYVCMRRVIEKRSPKVKINYVSDINHIWPTFAECVLLMYTGEIACEHQHAVRVWQWIYFLIARMGNFVHTAFKGFKAYCDVLLWPVWSATCDIGICSDLRSVTIHLQNYGPTSETLKHGHIRCNDFLIESCFRVHSSKISKQVNKCLFQTQWSICI